MTEIFLGIWTTLGTGLGAGLLTLLTRYISIRRESSEREKERLYDERRQIYLKILEPIIRIFAGINNPEETQKAMQQIKTYEHRRVLFELNLIGSDDVVRALNEFMQYLYRGDVDARQLLTYWGQLLLSIRKDLGNKGTGLSEVDMLRSQITDIDSFTAP